MFKLVVLSALVAVAVAAPSVVSPLIYSSPSLAYVQAAPSYAVIGSVPTSISKQSSTVVHNVGPVVADTPVVEVKAAEAIPEVADVAADAEVVEAAPETVPAVEVKNDVVETVPASITTQSSQVVHDFKPVVAAGLIQYQSPPVLQYAAVAAPIVQYTPYSIYSPVSSYSTHGIVNSAGYIPATRIVQSF